mmetsp:Transcript_46393/g.92036  ORF Transcript_46393/g.92036 Transcript_46393/m.92036 type:complete len:326 (+) Transcript_46393:109-1086(+)
MAAHGPGEECLKTLYDRQMTYTQKAAQDFGQALKLLREEEGNCQEPVDGQREKLNFFSKQMECAEMCFKFMLVQEAKFQHGDFLRAPSQAEEIKRNRFYTQAFHLLCRLEHSFTAAQKTSTSDYIRIYEEFQNIIQKHPKIVSGCAVLGAAIGAGVGAGVHGLVYPHGILHLGLHGLLNSHFGARGAIAVGGVGGCVVGLCIVALVVGVVVLFHEACDQENWERKKRKELDNLLRQLEHQDFPLEELEELSDLFHTVFVKPVDVAIDGDICPICHDTFRADSEIVSPSTSAVKAPGCAGNHFVHQRCFNRWMRSSGQMTCVICRQ